MAKKNHPAHLCPPVTIFNIAFVFIEIFDLQIVIGAFPCYFAKCVCSVYIPFLIKRIIHSDQMSKYFIEGFGNDFRKKPNTRNSMDHFADQNMCTIYSRFGKSLSQETKNQNREGSVVQTKNFK